MLETIYKTSDEVFVQKFLAQQLEKYKTGAWPRSREPLIKAFYSLYVQDVTAIVN
jgi:hypothetical protein